jgi:hypothetical protein
VIKLTRHFLQSSASSSSPSVRSWQNLQTVLDTRDALFHVLDLRSEDALIELDSCTKKALAMDKVVNAAFQTAIEVADGEAIPEMLMKRRAHRWQVGHPAICSQHLSEHRSIRDWLPNSKARSSLIVAAWKPLSSCFIPRLCCIIVPLSCHPVAFTRFACTFLCSFQSLSLSKTLLDMYDTRHHSQ